MHSEHLQTFAPESDASTVADPQRSSAVGVSMTGRERILSACRCRPVDLTPVWFLRQAGRYMPEYQAVRRNHSLLEICKTPALAAEVTITAAERLDVDAAIVFADLLLPLEAMGLDFTFESGEGPRVHRPVRTAADIAALKTDRTAELGYVGETVRLVRNHFGGRLATIGFCGAPFTLASYMVEGGGSRNYVETKRLMYSDSGAWRALMESLTLVLAEFAAQQVAAGADVIQIFDSWVGALSPADYCEYVLPSARSLVQQVRATGVPVIYFGVNTAGLLPTLLQTEAEVIGLDWRISLDDARRTLGTDIAVQGNLDPIALFAPDAVLRARIEEVLRRAGGAPGHIFNLGHGIVPGTPADSVRRTVEWVREISRQIKNGQNAERLG